MNPRERVWAALQGEAVDRPPISFWGHRYDRESSAAELVEATRDFQRDYGWDYVKLNPRKSYFAEDWGLSYRYSGSPVEKPVLQAWPIHAVGDWGAIKPLRADAGAYGEQLQAVRALRRALPADVPFVQTVFSPLGVAGEMVDRPARVAEHLRADPAAVMAALEAITRTLVDYVGAVLDQGADGIYFATTHFASRPLLSREEYRRFGRPFDLRVLAAARGASFNVLHVCKSQNLLRELSDYPVHAFSWAATDSTNPGLAEAREFIGGALVGGISQEGALMAADPAEAVEEFRRAFEQTGGQRWLVGPGCSIPPDTPAANLRALREAVEGVRVQ
jgi:uroporphyrinogen decarboxylase